MSNTSVSTAVGFPGVPEYLPNGSEHRRQIARMLSRVNQGKFNCTLDVTLKANTGATVISDNRIGYNSAVSPMMGMSLSAAVAVAAGIWCGPATSAFGSTTGTITVHHNITPDADKTIRFGIFG